MECKAFVQSLADPFHCKRCSRTREEHQDEDPSVGTEPFDLITVVLDRSGSMQSVKQKTIDGFNSFLHDQRSAGKALFTLVQFDDEYEVVYDAAEIAMVANRNAANYQPRGSTALLDAIGKAVAAAAEKVTALAIKPKSVTVSVITDGLENASVEFQGENGRKQIFEMLDERKKEGWQFFFIGAEPKAIEDAVRKYGFSASHAASYQASAPDEAFSRLSQANIDARAGLKSGFQNGSKRALKANVRRPRTK